MSFTPGSLSLFYEIDNTIPRFYNIKQESTISNAGYLERFNNISELDMTAEEELGNTPGLVHYSLYL